MHGPRSALRAISFILLIVGTLALTACNSNSVSGNRSNPSGSTNAEVTSSVKPPAGPRSQGILDAAKAQAR